MSAATKEFWTSDEGILIRLDDLAHDFSFRVYNGALQGYFAESGFKRFVWVSALMTTTCKYCRGQNGREYRHGQFLPRMPSHQHCVCFWDILMEL